MFVPTSFLVNFMSLSWNTYRFNVKSKCKFSWCNADHTDSLVWFDGINLFPIFTDGIAWYLTIIDQIWHVKKDGTIKNAIQIFSKLIIAQPKKNDTINFVLSFPFYNWWDSMVNNLLLVILM